MTRREPSAYVWDIRDACQSIAKMMKGYDRDRYLADNMCRLAIERCLIVLGEAMNRLSSLDPQMAGELGDVGGIVAFRNILVHAYFKIDHDRVWDLLTADLPALHAAADRVWARFAPLYPQEPQA